MKKRKEGTSNVYIRKTFPWDGDNYIKIWTVGRCYLSVKLSRKLKKLLYKLRAASPGKWWELKFEKLIQYYHIESQEKNIMGGMSQYDLTI